MRPKDSCKLVLVRYAITRLGGFYFSHREMGRGAFIYVILRARHILNFCFRTFLIYSDTDVVGIFVGIKKHWYLCKKDIYVHPSVHHNP